MDEREEPLAAVNVERFVKAGAYITREALARCVEAAQHQTPEDLSLSGRIRNDDSFDIAVTVELDPPRVVLLRYQGETEVFRRYNRDAVVATLEKLGYADIL